MMFVFLQGKTHVLVATDVAARGLDVNNVDLVVHWDVPQDSETYLHRSGRTGRAGNKGTAIMMIGQRDKGRVADIIRFVLFIVPDRSLLYEVCNCSLNFLGCVQGHKSGLGPRRTAYSSSCSGVGCW